MSFSLAYLQHHSSSSGGRTVAMRLQRRSRKRWVGRLFVKMSASWSIVDTDLIERSLQRTLSWTKWKFTSICFVLAWKTGLDAIARAETLSHHKIGASTRKTPSSLSKVWSQHNSAEAKARARYSDTILERETVSCFLADHVIGLEPRYTSKPEVDLLSSRSPAQSTSVKAESVNGPVVNDSPKWKVPHKYLRIPLAAMRWINVGEDMYWHTLCIANERSGPVKVR